MRTGDILPPVVDDMTYRRVVMGPGTTGDWFAGHYDPAYAQSQGQPAIYANSLQLFGLLDKAASSWAGPGAFLVRRAVRFQLSVYAGDTVTVSGTVRGLRDGNLLDLDVTAVNQDGGTLCTTVMTMRLAASDGSGSWS